MEIPAGTHVPESKQTNSESTLALQNAELRASWRRRMLNSGIPVVLRKPAHLLCDRLDPFLVAHEGEEARRWVPRELLPFTAMRSEIVPVVHRAVRGLLGGSVALPCLLPWEVQWCHQACCSDH